jgi:DNA mismatch repair protein MutS
MIDIQNDILKKYLSQPPQVSPELKKENELDNNDRMHLISKKLDDAFLQETYDNIINNKKYVVNDNTVDVNDYVFNDIEFLHDHYLNDEKGIFIKLNKCHTKIGSLILKNILLKPIHNVNVLKDRQNIFNKVSNIKNQLLPLLMKTKELENDLLWFWNDKNNKHIELMNDLIYFNYDFIPFFNLNEVLNNNEKALLITNIYKIIVAPLLTVLTPLISLLLPLIFLFFVQRKAQVPIPFTTIMTQYFKTLFGSDSMKMIFKNPSKAILASFVTKGIYVFMYAQNIYYSIQSSSNTNKIINIIHDKLNKLSEYTIITNNIKEICYNAGIDNITSYINYTKIQEDLFGYSNYFNYPVFKTKPSLFSNKGKILYTYKKFKMNKDNMTNIFHYTGTIDAILSIENILSNSNDNNPFCVTKYLNSKKPKINVKNIWHPYLDENTCINTVKNNIDMTNNILITGPNAGGKSTFIKSVIINIILSQTIGISSSKSFEITPFNMIETYLHIPDSKGCSSLFEAEMFRSKEYIEKIKNLDKDKFSFIVLDEIFSSTNFVEGFSGAYSILKKISSFSNTLSITTTHYTDLEILEKDTKGKIINYKFEVDHNENNEIIFNYKLNKGTSRQYIALELLKKNGFDDDVIEDAINMCKKITHKKIFTLEKKENSENKKKVKIAKNNKK